MDGPTGLSLGITLIGLWFFVQGLLGAIYWLIVVYRTSAHFVYPAVFEWNRMDLASMAVTVAQIVVGVLLIVGASGLKRLFYFVRYDGQ